MVIMVVIFVSLDMTDMFKCYQHESNFCLTGKN